ncbi:MAG: hypothetical protein K2K90_19430 [Lachnospiraceae bacterium]|nr:hypothetical protein [Lachnospiraceae bacterium]
MVSVEQPSMAFAASAGQSAAASLVVAPEKAEYTYTGKPIKPVLTVTDEAAGDTALVLNKDYTVSYSKNKAVGEAQITVKGKGNYSGTLKIPFTIKPVNLAEAETEETIVVRVNDIAYTGKALTPAIQVYETVDGRDRKLSGSAYTLSYANNTEKGTGTVTVMGKEKSGYTGTVTANFRIVDKAKLLSASAIKIDAISSQTFTGSAVKPVLHIVDKSDKNKEVTLEKGIHYEVAHRNNVNAGKATVTVRGVGSYAGIKDVTFKINKCAIADKNMLGTGLTETLKGTAVKPIPKVKVGKNSLKAGCDFTTSYQRNGVKGEAMVIIKGIGNYTGECRKTFIVQ